MLKRARSVVRSILNSPNMPSPRPALRDNFESNVPGIYVVGDLAGAPVVKLAMDQGCRVVRHIASAGTQIPGLQIYDIVIVGAGSAGLNAALEAQRLGLRAIVLEKNGIGSTIEGLPEGKWIYTEPSGYTPEGLLWLEETSKEDLVARWESQVRAAGLDVRTEEPVENIRRGKGVFEVTSPKGCYQAKRVILALGKSGTPRKLGVPGEDRPNVRHQLYNPKKHQGEDILVVGGGNSAVEAAVALAAENRVTLSYRGAEFYRITKENRRKLEEAALRGSLKILFKSAVERFDESTYKLADGMEGRYKHAFVLIGSDPPAGFLRAAGIRFENEWTGNAGRALLSVVGALCGLWIFGGQTGISGLQMYSTVGGLLALLSIAGLVISAARGNRFAFLGCSFLVAYTIYGAKQVAGQEFWPFRGWGFEALSFFDRPWSFWYTVLYTAVMSIFGIQAMKRWGFDRKDKFQIWRYASLLGFQWTFFFLIPEFLFRWAVEYQWLGAKLAEDPSFAQNAWRSYGLVYAWPLFFYTFFGNPHQFWLLWGVVLSFVILPVLVLFHGKRYCSWVCGCGGLAETLGDRWRHMAPKGPASIRWEKMNAIVLAAAAVITLMMVGRDVVALFRGPADASLAIYRLVADIWLVGILPVALYPFFGGKIWCRYWCPLAKMMEMFSVVYTRFRVSRFAIHANDKCIACEECSRNCQVGIDVMKFALKQEEITNLNSSCIGCGICVTVCPMKVLSWGRPEDGRQPVLIQIENAGVGSPARS
ncbi:MAG: NAD(P)-binding domain-containing protein [Bryobacteraceae bacterium]